MAKDRYEPIKLNQTNRYAGYQFHARVKVDGMDADSGFRYLILSVYQWIRGRVPENDRAVPELALPEAGEYASVPAERFLPYHFSVGYTMDITPLMGDGIWSLRLKEPDIGTDDRPPVSGRFFTTRVGLRLNEKGYTELGIRIDVTDPASEEKEIDFAFRPAFVRSLAIQPSVCFEQIREMDYGQPLVVSNAGEYKQFLYMLENEENQLPLVVFTHYRRGGKKPVSASIEEFMKSGLVDSFPQPPGMGFGMPGKKEIPMPDMLSVTGMPALKPGVVRIVKKKVVAADAAIPAAGMPVPDASAPSVVPELLHDANAFARSVFGYAQAVVLGDDFFDKFSSRVKKEIRPGDIVLCGARKFRGEVSVIGAFIGDEEDELKKAYMAALLSAQSYSKHKAAYSYGSVVFEAEARKLAQRRELERILESGQLEEKERYAQLAGFAEEQKAVIDEKDRKISRLEKQCEQEYDRGVASMNHEKARLDDEISRLRKKLADEQEKNRLMLGTYQNAQDVLEALERSRKEEKLPADNADVVRHFMRVYPDRLGFTERGEWEASRCGLKTDHLWEILYMVANDLTDLFREKEGNLTEEEVARVAGCEAAMQEGSMTRKDSTLMRLREDEYEGRKISVEPHLKLKSVKGEPAHQRLHFCYDPELRRVVIGYLGDHLESAASRYVKKR